MITTFVFSELQKNSRNKALIFFEDLLNRSESGQYNEWQQCNSHIKISVFCHNVITEGVKLKQSEFYRLLGCYAV
jgi:hypothetical protein